MATYNPHLCIICTPISACWWWRNLALVYKLHQHFPNTISKIILDGWPVFMLKMHQQQQDQRYPLVETPVLSTEYISCDWQQNISYCTRWRPFNGMCQVNKQLKYSHKWSFVKKVWSQPFPSLLCVIRVLLSDAFIYIYIYIYIWLYLRCRQS